LYISRVVRTVPGRLGTRQPAGWTVTQTQATVSSMADRDRGAADAALVERCRTGDRLAFDALVVKYQHRIYTLCVRMLGNREDGEDAAQEAFVKAYQGLERFRGNAAFSTWLYTIAVNICRNRQASFWRRLWRRSVKIDTEPQDDGGGGYEPPSTGPDPAQELARSRTRAAINRALGSLPADQREIVIMADVQGMAYEEIAAATGVAAGTVKSRLFRARERMRKAMMVLE